MLRQSIEKISKFRIQSINRGFFDKEHPEVNLGKWWSGYARYDLYDLKTDEVEKADEIIQDLYLITYENIERFIANTNENTKVQIIKYKDKQVPNDKERLYILIKNRTIRKTETTTLCRFYKSSNQVYIGIDSYVLGRLNWFSFIGLNLLFLCILIPTLFILLGLIIADLGLLLYALGNFDIGTLFVTIFSFISKILLSLPAVFVGIWIWGDIIKGLNQGESLERAIRQRFHKRGKFNSFDLDDITMYLKTFYPLVIDSAEQAFRKNGIEREDIIFQLRQVRDVIKNTTPNQTINNYGQVGQLSGYIQQQQN